MVVKKLEGKAGGESRSKQLKLEWVREQNMGLIEAVH